MGQLQDDEWVIRKRLMDDLPFYAETCLSVQRINGGETNMQFKPAQTIIHKALEKQRAKTGKVRALILKARREGASSYVQARFYHQVTHRDGCNAYILTHHSDSTNELFAMAERFHDSCPPSLRPATDAANAKELHFSGLGSGYKVATAGSKSPGRGFTIHLFHGSEVAYWANADDHWAGAMTAVSPVEGTEIILESTSNGPAGKFYEACVRAHNGEGDYQLIFLPWFIMEEYRKKVPQGFAPTDEEVDLMKTYGIDIQQVCWRREEVQSMGISRFRREFPISVNEAFTADAMGSLWKRDDIDKCRVRADQVPDRRRTIIAIDPATTNKEGSDETGIIQAFEGVDGHWYIERDLSGKYTPSGWANAAIGAYHVSRASKIVAEKNQGGDMVENTLRMIDQNVSYDGIHASDGKRVRAEPVASLYERGLVHHVGFLPGLEDQMTSWDASKDAKSPDRVDAMVYAIHELALEKSHDGLIQYYKLKYDAKQERESSQTVKSLTMSPAITTADYYRKINGYG